MEKTFGGMWFYDALGGVRKRAGIHKRYLAIDQGPIVAMIENYRSGLGWDLFMRAPEVQEGLKKLGFWSFQIKSKLNKQARNILGGIKGKLQIVLYIQMAVYALEML